MCPDNRPKLGGTQSSEVGGGRLRGGFLVKRKSFLGE